MGCARPGPHALSLEEEPPQSGQVAHTRADDPGASDHADRLDLRQALAALEPESLQLIGLRYFAGLDSSEIGAMLGVPPPTMRTRLRRALSLLRQRLEGHETNPYHDLAASAREKGSADV
jgi:RNA polymerase sigma-70 factor, ECF subfamily